jgi:hypothetical protein
MAPAKWNKESLQLIVVGVIIILWILGLIISTFDGNTMLKAVTPMMTLVFGWLFTAKAVEN